MNNNNPAGLTAREIEVARLLAEGETIKRTGVRLGISNKTVEFHSLNAKNKIGTNSIAVLTHYAIGTGLVALKFCLIGAFILVAGCKSPQYSPPPSDVESRQSIANILQKAQRRTALVAVQTKTNGIVSLGWDGSPTNTTIIDQATGASFLVVSNQTITIGQLSEVPHTFIATNQFGASNPLVVVPPPNTNRLVLFVERYALDNNGKAGILQSSRNGIVYVDAGFVGANSRVYIPNTNVAAFYRMRY